jgi:hypothetical protein
LGSKKNSFCLNLRDSKQTLEFNWSIIVSVGTAELERAGGRRWAWNKDDDKVHDDDDDDDDYTNTHIVVLPSILLSHPITSPSKTPVFTPHYNCLTLPFCLYRDLMRKGSPSSYYFIASR